MSIKSEKSGLEVVEYFAIEKLFSEQKEEKFCRVSFLDEEIIIKNDSLIELLEEIIARFTNK
ncbi:MAG: hypothetical protein AABZ74_11405 [Cyanobacteriota bacterium]